MAVVPIILARDDAGGGRAAEALSVGRMASRSPTRADAGVFDMHGMKAVSFLVVDGPRN
jgi:hypothetical protein